MASLDGARSLQWTSDEDFELVCGPCETERIRTEAKHYCVNCQEYLCDSCRLSHKKLRILKNHEVLSGSNMPRKNSITQCPKCVVYCSCNQNLEVNVYCKSHDDVICNSCKTLSHRKCEIYSLQDKAAGYNFRNFDSIVKKTESLKDGIKQIQIDARAKSRELDVLKEKCRKEIKNFREDINTFLDQLEQNTLQELDKRITDQTITITDHISSGTLALERLDSHRKMLEEAEMSNKKEKMFASEIKVSKILKGCETLIVDLQKDVMKPTLSFERNKMLIDMQRNINSLGCLIGNMDSATPLKTGVLLGLKISSHSQVNVALPGEGDKPWISGSCFMPNGYLLLCDYENGALKLLDGSFAMHNHLKLSSDPYDISVIDDNNAVITLPTTKQIQFVQVFPKMKVSSNPVIQLDKDCCGVHVSGGEIYTSLIGYYEGEVRIFDLRGTLKRIISLNKDQQPLFECPDYLTVGKTDKKIFVSDWSRQTVTCTTAGGSIIYQTKAPEFRGLRGIYVDAEDNVYVCCKETNNVYIITADGRLCRSLVSNSDGIEGPCSVCYRDSDKILAVGCYKQDNIFCYTLS